MRVVIWAGERAGGSPPPSAGDVSRAPGRRRGGCLSGSCSPGESCFTESTYPPVSGGVLASPPAQGGVRVPTDSINRCPLQDPLQDTLARDPEDVGEEPGKVEEFSVENAMDPVLDPKLFSHLGNSSTPSFFSRSRTFFGTSVIWSNPS